MATTTGDELDLDEQKRQAIGKPIVGPKQTAAQVSLSQPIGKPIAQAQPSVSDTNILPGVDTGSSMTATPPPEMPASDTISGMGSLEPQAKPVPSVPLTPRPEYHGVKRLLDTIAGATKIGSDVEAASGMGTEGWRQKNADEEMQLNEAAKQRQAGAVTAETEANTAAKEAGMQNVTITDPVSGHTMSVPASQAPAIWKAIVTQGGANKRTADTNQTREDIASDTNATRSNIAADTNETRQGIAADTNQTRRDIAKSKPTPQAEQAITDHLASQGLPDTPENRDQARLDMSNEKVAGALDAKGTEAVAELGKSAQQAYKKLQALAKEDSDPANYAFLMSFIGLSYEAIKGARLNQAEIVRAAATRTLPDQLQHVYDLYIQKRLLTPEQKQEMLKTAGIIAGTYGGNIGESKSEPSAGGGTSQSAPTHKVGETVSIKGKTMRITQVHPDGSFDAQ